MQTYVPVISSTGKPLMPTSNRKANRLIEKGRAIRRFDRGLFYLKLIDRGDGYTQPIVIGIDPGSKKEAFTAKAAAHTYLNVQADAVTWVSDAEETSTTMRRGRRGRKTPYRPMRTNRRQGQFKLPPSTRARWGWKLRLCGWLTRYYPISLFVVEDIAAVTKSGKRRWNASFSPLEVGKAWFYAKLGKLAAVETRQGYETKALRDQLGLKKSKQKLSDSFAAHCVDSWVLANASVGGHVQPDNSNVLYVGTITFSPSPTAHAASGQRRAAQALRWHAQPGFQARLMGLKHPKHGVCYVGGTTAGTISLHRMQDGLRIAKVKPETVTFLCTAAWRIKKGERHSAVA